MSGWWVRRDVRQHHRKVFLMMIPLDEAIMIGPKETEEQPFSKFNLSF